MKTITLNELSGNEILLINLLKYNRGSLTKTKFLNKLTFKRRYGKKILNVAMTEPTFVTVTHDLEAKGLIEIVKGNSRLGIENTYNLILSKARIENTVEVSHFINLAVIWGAINPSELKLYILMRYLHKEQQRESSNTLKGNLFRINQSDLAKAYYGTITSENKGNISVMIEGLIDAHILEVWSIDKNEKGNDYYTYRLVC